MYNNFADFLNKKFRVDAHYFLRGGFWLSLTQATIVLSGLITTALFAHFLTEADYGIYRYLISLAVIISTFSLTGIGQSIFQTSSKGYANFYLETIKINLAYNTGVFLLGTICSTYYFINGNNFLALGCLCIAFFQPLINTYQFIPSYLQGNQKFQTATVVQSFKAIFVSITSIIVLLLSKNILLLFLTYLTANLLANCLSHLILRPQKTIDVPPDIFHQFFSYAKHTSVRNLISSISYRVDSIVIFTQLGAAELAIYSIATLIPEQIKGSFKNLSNLLLPKYSQHEKPEILKKSVSVRSFQLFLILTSITVFYVAFVPYVYLLFFPKYMGNVFYSQIFALAFPAFITIIPLTVLQSQLNEKALHKINNQNTFLGLILTISLTILYGVLGAILAKVLTRYINTLYVYYIFYKE